MLASDNLRCTVWEMQDPGYSQSRSPYQNSGVALASNPEGTYRYKYIANRIGDALRVTSATILLCSLLATCGNKATTCTRDSTVFLAQLTLAERRNPESISEAEHLAEVEYLACEMLYSGQKMFSGASDDSAEEYKSYFDWVRDTALPQFRELFSKELLDTCRDSSVVDFPAIRGAVYFTIKQGTTAREERDYLIDIPFPDGSVVTFDPRNYGQMYSVNVTMNSAVYGAAPVREFLFLVRDNKAYWTSSDLIPCVNYLNVDGTVRTKSRLLDG